MASGIGMSYFPSLSYNPVPGVRKSGIPAEQLAPAPTRTTILENFASESFSARDSTDNGSCSEDEEKNRVDGSLWIRGLGNTEENEPRTIDVRSNAGDDLLEDLVIAGV